MGILNFLFGKRAGKANDRKIGTPVFKKSAPRKEDTPKVETGLLLSAVTGLAERCEETSAAGRTEWLMLITTFYVARLYGETKISDAALRELFLASTDARDCLPSENAFLRLYRSKYPSHQKELSDLGFIPGSAPLPDARPVHSFVGAYIEPLKPDLRYVGIRAKNMEPQLREYTKQLRAFLTEFSASIK